MNRKVLLTTAAVSSAFGSVVGGQGIAAQPVTDPEAYAVYETLTFGKEPVVLLSQQTMLEHCSLREIAPPEWRSTVESFERENSRPRSLDSTLFKDQRFKVLTTGELTGPLGHLPHFHWEWEVFTAEFQNKDGYFSLSAVGFDESRTKAYVSVTNHRNSSGSVVPLEKVDGRWVPARGKAVTCTISGD
jgi:hypothetical protein